MGNFLSVERTGVALGLSVRGFRSEARGSFNLLLLRKGR